MIPSPVRRIARSPSSLAGQGERFPRIKEIGGSDPGGGENGSENRHGLRFVLTIETVLCRKIAYASAMSRLDSFIRRLTAQREILNDLRTRLEDVPGPIFEFGLGSGRTYDHLREHFPTRRIVVFECETRVIPLTGPPPEDLVIGDIRETASRFPEGCAALIHADIETGVATRDAALAAWLPGLVARLLAPRGYGVSGSALPDPRLASHRLPSGIQEGRYHLVRRV